MKSKICLGMTCLLFLISMSLPRASYAQESVREFVLASSYGVLAGTLVGAATLAFSDRPGDNLNKVARGASIGLYCGILLGFYIVYGVPSESDEYISWDWEGNKPIDNTYRIPTHLAYKAPREALGLSISPVFGDRGIEGAQGSLKVFSF